ncbi:hypothetical protein mru_1101 [Methanobrevibacter ruminantium M1]|uniref:Uncharacterized protein n=1 Tax=Methanobrevibacter ruminantium (strain ATCC 35063 / DSM 1093 / JCM 13430 / OCM 146 / M1) TaxID=634498 RepID=D3E341_METRM|nr:hypothetical protein mru_1101 [Methanobrevibacter ruminantium M1]
MLFLLFNYVFLYAILIIANLSFSIDLSTNSFSIYNHYLIFFNIPLFLLKKITLLKVFLNILK